MAVGNFNLPLQGDYWSPQSDWIDISSVGNNEINLLVRDGYALKFIVDVASSGTYSVDWGDGTIENSRASGTGYSHLYAFGSGTTCSLGYTTYKIRIYNATANITRFRFTNLAVADIGYIKNSVNTPVLWVVMGTTGLTQLDSAFNTCSLLQAVYLPSTYTSLTTFNSTFANCGALRMVKNFNVPWGSSLTNLAFCFSNCTGIRQVSFPTTMPNSITTVQSMFDGCVSLEIVNMSSNWSNSLTNMAEMFDECRSLREFKFPSAWPTTASAVNAQAMFRTCRNLVSIDLPSSWPTTLNSVGLSYMFGNCSSLQEITLPSGGFRTSSTNLQEMFVGCTNLVKIDLGTSWGGVTQTPLMFAGCSSLAEVILPTTISGITAANGMFQNCTNLQKLTNTNSLGTETAGAGCNFTDFMGVTNTSFVTGITTNSYISRFGAYGTTTNTNWLEACRLTQSGSTYTGTSPQINVSYNRLGQAALVDMFNDLPTLVGKTINITGNPGAPLLTAGERAIATGKGWTITG